jgi:hypothetical protein
MNSDEKLVLWLHYLNTIVAKHDRSEKRSVEILSTKKNLQELQLCTW